MKKQTQSKWTLFWDMHSGGGSKEQHEKIYIEAPEEEAKIIFYNKFGHSPDRVSCTCCGSDYSISESDSLEQASGYHRNCEWSKKDGGYIDNPDTSENASEFIPLEKYSKQKDVLVIYAKDISDNERIGELPEEGYIWH